MGSYNLLTLKGDVEKLPYGKVHCEVKFSKKNLAIVFITQDPKKNACTVRVYGNRKGKTTATITVWYGKNQKKDLKLPIVVNKISGKPFTSFKIGETDFASRLKPDKSGSYASNNFYDELKGSQTVNITAQTGWKISDIYAYVNNGSKKIKNGGKINTKKCNGIDAILENKKTKSRIDVTMYW